MILHCICVYSNGIHISLNENWYASIRAGDYIACFVLWETQVKDRIYWMKLLPVAM